MMLFRISFALMVAFSLACATGDKALDAMTSEERALAEGTLYRITHQSTEADVERLFGRAADQGAGTMRPCWYGPDGGLLDRVYVYFLDGKAFKVRYAKIGAFVWERSLTDT